MDGKDEILASIRDLKDFTKDKFAEGEKRMDRQDLVIGDIQDQIKGNAEKDIFGIRPALKEVKSILIIPILIKRMPTWAKWVLAAICVDAIADIGNIGVISFLQYLIHITKP